MDLPDALSDRLFGEDLEAARGALDELLASPHAATWIAALLADAQVTPVGSLYDPLPRRASRRVELLMNAPPGCPAPDALAGQLRSASLVDPLLRSLGAEPQLARFTALERLEIVGGAWRSLESLPPLPTVRELKLEALTALERLDGIERLSGLKKLTLREAKQPLDVSALGRLPALEDLDLRDSAGVTDVSALYESPTIRAIMLADSGVPRRGVVPRSLRWRCSWQWTAYFMDVHNRSPPSPPRRARRSAEARTSIAALRKMIKTGDLEVIDQALALLTSLADPSYFDALLKGAGAARSSRSRVLGRWATQLTSKKLTGLTRSYVLCGLLAAADTLPEDSRSASADALRDAIDEPDFFEPTNHLLYEPHPLDLLHLEALPRLKKLCLHHFGPFTEHERSPHLPGLQRFELYAPKTPVSLDWLADCADLTELKLVRLDAASWDGDLSFVAGKPLRSVWLETCEALSDLSALNGLQRLERLFVRRCGLTRLGALTDLPALKELRIEACYALGGLDGLGELPALEIVEIPRAARGFDASALERQPALRRVTTHARPLPDLSFLEGSGVALVNQDPLRWRPLS